MIIFITGTGTDVGKTIATAALASVYQQQGNEVVVAKPVQTGEPEGSGDAVTVAGLAGVETTEFIRYPEPLAPNLTARRAGQPQLVKEDLLAWISELDALGRIVLVEGAGGLLVRLADDLTIVDLASDLNAPVVVVTSLGLGSLNWAELTVREAQRHGLDVAGLIGGKLSADPDLATSLNVNELENVTGVEVLGCIPEGAGRLAPDEFAQMARGVFGQLPIASSSSPTLA